MDNLERIWGHLDEATRERLKDWKLVLEEIGDPLHVITLDDAGQVGVWRDSEGVFTLWRMGPDHLWKAGSLQRCSMELVNILSKCGG